jgi:hypothetical protein
MADIFIPHLPHPIVVIRVLSGWNVDNSKDLFTGPVLNSNMAVTWPMSYLRGYNLSKNCSQSTNGAKKRNMIRGGTETPNAS